MTASLNLAPLVPLPLIIGLAAVALALLAVAAARRARGWLLRALAVVVLAAALLNPRMAGEEHQPVADLALVVVDRSASQQVGDRAETTTRALAHVTESLARFDDLEVRVVEAPADGADAAGTLLFGALEGALAEEVSGRLAGAIVITDGQIHDAPAATADRPPMTAPLHVLLTGARDERDRRLVVEQAPGYGLVGQPASVTFRVEERGAGEGRDGTPVQVTVRRDGAAAERFDVPVGRTQTHEFVLDHAGPTILELAVEATPDELSAVNNRALVTVNGVRDRLRVLLVSGQPHAGERTWRNLLKADPSVELVHFTILRPPEKEDMTPIRELALIVFPVRELFDEKIREFDLIVFDRYVVRDVLPPIYLSNIVDYVAEGGAVLLAVGPEFAGPRSLFRTSLSTVLPASPTGRVLEGAFRPVITDLGRRHPVTSDLPGATVSGAVGDAVMDDPAWGQWFRMVEAAPRRGDTLMAGHGDQPLLVVDRFGEGRIAQVLSDHIWLWARGYDGGGPHAELLRRLAHWLMKEPDLEEESLTAGAETDRVLIERRSLDDAPVTATVTGPDGATTTVDLRPGDDGVARAEVPATLPGLYRVDDGTRTALIAAGAIESQEFSDLRATTDRLAPTVEASGGGLAWIGDGLPDLRRVAPGRDTAGRGWIGLVRNDTSVITGVVEVSLLPGLLVVALGLIGLMAAWWREGR